MLEKLSIPNNSVINISREKSFIDLNDDANNYILEKLDPKAGKTQGIEIIVDAKSDRKANYSINFVDSSNTALDKISIDYENFQIFVPNSVRNSFHELARF